MLNRNNQHQVKIKKLQRKNEEYIQNGTGYGFKISPAKKQYATGFKVSNLLNQNSNDGLDIGGGDVNNISFARGDNIKILEN